MAKEIKNNSNGKPNVLVDLSETVRGTVRARMVTIKSIKTEPLIYGKIALFGANKTNRVMANLVIKASGRHDKVRYFDTENEAEQWLRK